jgi:tripartite-type tricarboxylate transporter receptor subunit TctC
MALETSSARRALSAMNFRQMRTLLVALSFCTVALGPAEADDGQRPFYQGKKMQVVVGFAAGGGYDAYARLVARRMVKYIPGNPTILVQNMPGAGSRVAANWLYSLAAKDGTVLGSVVQSTPLDQVFKEPGVQYDARRFNWIGNPIVDNLVSITSAQSGLVTLEDVKAKGGLICGSSGAGPTVAYPNAIGKLLQVDTRVVSGYPGVSDITLAMQRGEVNCNGGQAWSSAKATMGQLLHDRKFLVLVQWGTEADSDISAVAGRDVPLITNYARNDAERGALRLLASTSALSRPLLAPPELPADRVTMLRKAFDQTMQDPDFLADAKKSSMDIRPKGGAEIQQLVEGIVNTPADQIALAVHLTR